MYQYTLEGSTASSEYLLSLRNAETKKYICKHQPVQCHLQESEELRQKIVDLIKTHGATFQPNEVPACFLSEIR